MFQSLLKKKETKRNNEVRTIVSYQFMKLRYEFQRQEKNSIDVFKNSELAIKFKNIAIHCFENFSISDSHKTYISQHLQNEWRNSTSIMNNQETITFLENNNLIQGDKIFIEMPLRALEVLFGYGKFDITYFQSAEIMSMILDFYQLKEME